MRISQKLDYACRAMVQLAKRHDGKTLTRLEELAQREAVSANFLVQILNDLKRAGLVDSRRGKTGGYLLPREPSDITLLDIILAVEPGILASNPSGDGESSHALRLTWDGVALHIRRYLESLDLRQLVDRGADPMYYI
ncbi:MAG: Rrf2 family transcriptional regulator [Akkermansiaceae bacterium]|jgi:Rrf2 family protein|nr:Rrf2 family transcriptional regulator [Akkermansiaceae bacterium]